jgi:hypothetical protein
MKKFTEYRAHDYRVPRSMKEAYGRDVPLFIEEKPVFDKTDVIVSILLMGIAACAYIV